MKLDRFFQQSTSCLLALLLFGACTTSPREMALPPPLASKLAPVWIASAERLQSGNRTVYYRGRASTEPGSGARHWSGTIKGEVLILEANMAIVVPSGTFTLHSNGAVAMSGPHTIITDRSDSWKHLLVP